MTLPIEIKRSEQPNQYFQINWMLHDRCTYKCSYCIPSNYAGSDSWLDINKILNTCKNIKEQVSIKYPNLKMQILLGGGEPTVWKDFKTLVNTLYENDWSIHLVSNNTRSLSWWKTINIHWDYLGLSLHPEFCIIEEFVEKCNYLINKSNILIVRVMLHPDDDLFIKSIQYADFLQKNINNIIIQWIPISYNFGGIDIKLPKYTDKQKIIIKNLLSNQKKYINPSYKLVTWDDKSTTIANGNYLIASDMHNFSGWDCFAGIDGIFIDSKGYIHRGTCLEGGSIGHILDNDIKLYNKSIICQKTSCTCVADVLYSKKKL